MAHPAPPQPARLPSRWVVALVAAFALVTAACGSGDTTAETTGTPDPGANAAEQAQADEQANGESLAPVPGADSDTGSAADDEELVAAGSPTTEPAEDEPSSSDDTDAGTDSDTDGGGGLGIAIPTPTPELTDDDQPGADEPATVPTNAPTAPTPTQDDPIADPTPATQSTDGQCVAEQPTGPVNVTSAVLDWDGDGRDDILNVYGLGQFDAPEWRIRVDTAAGESLDSPLTVDPGTGATVIAIGGADVDGDGARQEAFAVTGRGAAATIVSVFVQVDCAIVAATLNGAPISFPIGGSEFNIGGLSCSGPNNNNNNPDTNNTVWAWSGTSSDGTNWLIDGVEFQLNGSDFSQVSTQTIEANTTQPAFNYPFLLCDEVNFI